MKRWRQPIVAQILFRSLSRRRRPSIRAYALLRMTGSLRVNSAKIGDSQATLRQAQDERSLRLIVLSLADWPRQP
jgi:hypothetical protein